MNLKCIKSSIKVFPFNNKKVVFPAECLAPFLPTRQRLILFVPQLRTDLGMAAYLSGTRSFRSILLSVGPLYWSLLRQQIAHRLSHLGTTRRIRNYN